jgi:peptidoglycan hydrolase-like protein with peptidoglycan-binding domain
MSRSQRASTEGCEAVRAVTCGAGNQARLGEHTRLEYVLGTAFSMTRLIWVVAASVTALALGPSAAMAATGTRPHAQLRATGVQNSHTHNAAGSAGRGRRAASARPSGRAISSSHSVTVVLARGRGYDARGGSRLVRSLQRQLAKAGFAPGHVDGLYGPRTERAVRSFQAARGLQVDGIAGPATRTALASRAPALYPGAGYVSGGSRQVRELQRRVLRAGYAPGPIDGLYGPRTEQAVRRFQRAHRLPVDGVASPRTFADIREQPRSHHQAHRSPSRLPRPAHPKPAQAPTNAPRTSQPSSSPLIAGLVLLAALGLVLSLVRYRGRRASEGLTASPARRDSENDSAALEHQAAPAIPLASRNGRATETEDRADADADANGAFNLAALLEEQKDLAGAEAAYRRADRRGHAPAASNLGVLLEGRGDLAGAEAAYRRADERGDANGAFNLAELLEEQKDLAGAEAAYRRADRRGHAPAASNLGVLLEGRGDLAGAEAAYRRADERGDANGAFNLAALLEEQKDLAGAEAAYRRANHRGPGKVATTARAALLELKTSKNAQNDRNGGDLHVE